MNKSTSIAIIGLVLLAGCGPQSEGLPDLAPVTGTITMDGEPLANASVTFGAASGATSYATTGADGTYELNYIRSSKGAGIGPNTVRIETATDAPPSPGWRDPIPSIYNRRTTLQADVKKGEPNIIDFALESKPAKQKR